MGGRWLALAGATLAMTCAPVVADARDASPADAVVALVDSGINPYHAVFRDDSPRAYRHPSTYIPGFPKEAEALPISLDEDNYQQAVEKDCALWRSVKPNTVYWFPGTKIVGAVTFVGWPHASCSTTPFAEGGILDGNGHGTMVASRAAGNGYGACPDCRIVAVQGLGRAMRWAARNSDWIDVQSNSWGPIAPAWAPAGDRDTIDYNTPAFVRDVEAAARKHLAFWATGNGVATRAGVLGHPTIVDPRMTPSVVMVGGHDSGYINLWPGFPPHVVSDSCNSWAAASHHLTRSADDIGSGTSAATPFAAGTAARILLEARRILGDGDTGVVRGVVAAGAATGEGPLKDGEFTLEEWKEIVFKTATKRPEGQKQDGSVCGPVEGLVLYSSTPVRWTDVPDAYPEYLHIGYGALDAPARDLAFEVLRGDEELPDRTETDRYFEADRQVRERLHEVYGGP